MFVHIPVQEALAVLSGGGKPNANAVSGCKTDDVTDDIEVRAIFEETREEATMDHAFLLSSR